MGAPRRRLDAGARFLWTLSGHRQIAQRGDRAAWIDTAPNEIAQTARRPPAANQIRLPDRNGHAPRARGVIAISHRQARRQTLGPKARKLRVIDMALQDR